MIFDCTLEAGLNSTIYPVIWLNDIKPYWLPLRRAFVPLLKDQGLDLVDLSKVSDKLLAVLLQSIVLKPYTAEQLAGLKTAPSALEDLLKEDYPLTFATEGGKVRI